MVGVYEKIDSHRFGDLLCKLFMKKEMLKLFNLTMDKICLFFLNYR